MKDALRRLGVRLKRLETDELIASARDRAGLTRFRDEPFVRASLDAFIASFDRDLPVHPEAVRQERSHILSRLMCLPTALAIPIRNLAHG